jgi:hypothetical protein
MNNQTTTSSVAATIAHLSNSRGEYIDGHNNRTTTSRTFAVLAIDEERHVCPLPSFRDGSTWVSTLNPITVKGETARLSIRALHTLNQKGESVFDAALAFNEAFKSSGVKILDIFTVL